jgi:hypothetical protein
MSYDCPCRIRTDNNYNYPFTWYRTNPEVSIGLCVNQITSDGLIEIEAVNIENLLPRCKAGGYSRGIGGVSWKVRVDLDTGINKSAESSRTVQLCSQSGKNQQMKMQAVLTFLVKKMFTLQFCLWVDDRFP